MGAKLVFRAYRVRDDADYEARYDDGGHAVDDPAAEGRSLEHHDEIDYHYGTDMGHDDGAYDTYDDYANDYYDDDDAYDDYIDEYYDDDDYDGYTSG